MDALSLPDDSNRFILSRNVQLDDAKNDDDHNNSKNYKNYKSYNNNPIRMLYSTVPLSGSTIPTHVARFTSAASCRPPLPPPSWFLKPVPR